MILYNNIITAFEILHSMNNHKLGKSRFMTLKLYVSKTYDRTEWTFLEVIMQQPVLMEGGSILWCHMWNMYHSTFLLIGNLKAFIYSFRGIHRGEALSPFLFLLCNESLLSLISWADRDSSIREFFFEQEKSHINTSVFLQMRVFSFAWLIEMIAKGCWLFWKLMKEF